jgi:Flp pilus assembly protein TadB
MDSLHPIIRPPDVGHEPHNPVRDPDKLAPTEDLDREPDGVPHDVVGLTALFSVILAILVAAMFLSGHIVGQIAAVALVVIAVPTLVTSLRRRAERERDRVHPSR